MTVLNDILEWSVNRPLWQRDALRRIVTHENLSDQDVAELCRICLAQQNITEPDNPPSASEPLAAEHLSSDGNENERVQLVSLREVENVNNLAAGQQITFELNGMTLVFGYNGSGKSGYARILRQLCHARHRGDRILTSAFSDDDQLSPSATVDYCVAGAVRTDNWQQDQDLPTDLARISFFDADCAAIHVDEANKIAFTPFGLDVLPKLANVCRQVGHSIDELIHEQENNVPPSLLKPQAAEETEVRKLLEELNENSQIETYRRMAELSEEDLERIAELRESLGTDPASRAREIRNAITRLRSLQSNIQTVADALSAESVEGFRVKLQDAITKKAAAKTAAEEAFSGQPLSGVGEAVWQELWKSAQAYSLEHAYPEHDFPVTVDDTRCVLCQQILDQDAKDRLASFDEFIKADTQQAAKQSEVEMTRVLDEIRLLTVGHAVYNEYLSDIPEEQHVLNKLVRQFCKVAWKIQRSILQSYSDALWTSPCELPSNPTHDLETLIEHMTSRADELQRAATDVERTTFIKEQEQLVARQWLGSVLDDVHTEINRKKKLVALKAAKSTTVTTGITIKSSELADKYVTDVLRESLKTEIRKLGANYLRVELDSTGGQFGHKQFKIALEGASDDIEVSRVLSEGEFRCIALASFLAELSTEQSKSALIFDDPVCSLDQRWRRKVARRLVELAAERQVIIFTHDIVFLADVVESCKSRRIPLRHSYVRRGPTQPGECLDGLPWLTMKVKDRIGRLRDLYQTAKATHRRHGLEAYEPEARRIYGLLRETWERAVEESLLNGVVKRYEIAIHTNQLNPLADITEADIQKINDGMTKTSRFLEGHDEAEAVAEPVPEPDELYQDITDLEEWISEIRRRRR